MIVNIFSYSDKGCQVALEISKLFKNSNCFAIEKFASKYPVQAIKSTASKVDEVFGSSDLIIFVGACGIAVRSISKNIQNKSIDPAVVVVDDCKNFAISLLSGHIGGANEYCKFIAENIGACPVITTATDINNKFSVDSFAKKQDLHISSMKTAMEFSAEILKRDLPIFCGEEIQIKTKLSNSIFLNDIGNLGVYIGYEKIKPFENTLNLVPKVLSVGIGCRKGIEKEKIETLFFKVLNENNIDINAIKCVSSIDIKSEEKGLLDFCKDFNFSPKFFSSEELLKVEGEFSSSSFVKSITGVDNVCERSAIRNSNNGKIIVKKTCLDGVTIAVVCEEKEIYFE